MRMGTRGDRWGYGDTCRDVENVDEDGDMEVCGDVGTWMKMGTWMGT